MHSERKTHFDQLYRNDNDPWNYTSSGYERDKYDATIARLTRPHYASVIEVGCSIGVLSARLRLMCDRFLGLDLSERALRLAGRRLAHCSNVALRQVEVPHRWPRRKADLIVLSEVLYYLDRDELAHLAECVDSSLLPGAEVVIVAWTGRTGTALSGIAAARIFIDALSRLRALQIVKHPAVEGYVHFTATSVTRAPRQRTRSHKGSAEAEAPADGHLMKRQM
ncbi:MAG: nodulation S family protein [Rhodobacterales bacterium]|nr:nodulation S family protein [Rhodobacterales bacterium]MDX5414044.1 nodulation S family protein [Rhodobacterales bacterium]